jgi:hypothetical protein
MITYDLGSNVVSNEGFDSMFISLYEMRHTTAVCYNFFDSIYIDFYFIYFIGTYTFRLVLHLLYFGI